MYCILYMINSVVLSQLMPGWCTYIFGHIFEFLSSWHKHYSRVLVKRKLNPFLLIFDKNNTKDIGNCKPMF